MDSSIAPQISRRDLFRVGGVGAAGLSLAALTGCSVFGSGSGGSSATTFTIAYFGDQKSATALQKRLAPKIRSIDKSITLSINAVNGTDWNDFFSKILTQIAAGSPPDIVGVPTEGLQLLAEKGLAIPLDDYVTKDMSKLKSYFADVHPSLVEAMMYKGHLYELPVDFNAGNMFFDTTLFQRAGVAAPAPDWTFDDFEAAGRKIATLPNVNAFDWVVRLWGSWTSFMYANGGNLLEEGKYAGGDWLWNTAYAGDSAAKGRQGGWKWGQPTANSAAVVESLEYMIELKKAGLSPSPDVGGGGTLQGLFSANRIGMAIGGGFWAGGLHDAGMKNGSFDVQYFPTGKVQRQLLGTGGYAIFKSSKKKDLAWEIVKLLIEPESFDIIYPGNTTTSARRSLSTAARYKTTGPEHWQTFYDSLSDVDVAPIPAPPIYNALATSLNQRTTQAISTGNAKSALDGMQRDLESALASKS
ncbi:ABC transporter substrate-binding protein [Frondihabitans sucicola]|uniref:ABC transporter substrate-binding protein n=1 Tax=Frondihabitans sucicola TaxID=1268041 RepID=A0ABN6XXZ7_9MICO|nr:sugar ABC transporter substrate-binding protein [Frondihabitans sucicola]BDZ48541.1 ABC transporter substrate-binding protein [Frondihabitans sucicola]